MTTENLEALAAEAGALDAPEAEAGPGAQPAPEAQAVDMPAEVAALLKTAAAILTPAFPCLAEIYTEATCRQLGEAAAPVMDKYGLSVGGLFDRWGAEITLAATALPVAVATWHGVKADLAARRAPADEPAATTEPPAGA